MSKILLSLLVLTGVFSSPLSFAEAKKSPVTPNCTVDVQQMQAQLDRWGGIKTQNHELLSDMSLKGQSGGTCRGTGELWGSRRSCSAVWVMGNWGKSLVCYR